MAKKTTKKAAPKAKANKLSAEQKRALAAYLKEPNFTKLAKRFNMSPMGFRARVLRAAVRKGVQRPWASASVSRRCHYRWHCPRSTDFPGEHGQHHCVRDCQKRNGNERKRRGQL